MNIDENPDFSGRVREKSDTPLDTDRPPLLAWSSVYVANLIIPVLWGSMSTRGGGRVGMLIGIIVVFALGCRVCFVSRRAVLTVVYGGWIVAASQALPVLQMFAGSIGLIIAADATGAAGATDFEGDFVASTVLGGFIATLATGCLLIAVAAALGAIIQGIISRHDRGTILRAKPFDGEAFVV